MSAKTQSKIAQFVVKQRLRRLLKKRSILKNEESSKEAREELDASITAARDYLESNKSMLDGSHPPLFGEIPTAWKFQARD